MDLDLYASNPGPINDFVLHEQEKHVSSAVWEGQERGALRCHEHTSKLDQWTLTETQLDLVKKAGFGYLRLIPAISLDNPLISALVERWRKETNTFHLNIGEMTVRLEDVAYLIGLAIDGEPVIGVTYTSCEKVCKKYLGRTPDPGYISGGMVKLSWLKEFFSKCPEDAPMDVIECYTRAYLLYLLGSTIFSTTTGNKVPVMYLQLFEDFDNAGKYAWGAAALAFLYRALGNASVKTQSTISGCLTLLQCWSYYHLNIGRPKLTYNPIHDGFPLVLKWKGKQSSPTTSRDVGFYRKLFDSLKPCDVEWLPYTNINDKIIPEDIKSNLILGRSDTMLICFDKAERHLPNRCLRQYGLPQPIPKAVRRWERKSRGVDGGVDLSGKMEVELSEWLDRYNNIVEDYEGVEESEYMLWYMNITRKFVGRPIPISSEFQKMTATLREITHIADTMSTLGMDEQQLHSVTSIRYITHECLKEQVGYSITVSETPLQIESVKRGRGKERVRRKCMGKRRRKDGSEEYHDPSDEDQSGYCVLPVELDHTQLPHVDNEVDHLHLSQGDNMELRHATNTMDDSQLRQLTGELGYSHLDIDVNDDHGLQPIYHMAKEDSDSKFDHMINEIDESELCRTINQVDDSDNYQTDNQIDGSELQHMANGHDDVDPHCSLDQVDESQGCQTDNQVSETQISNMVDDSQPSRIIHCHNPTHVTNSAVYDTTMETGDSQHMHLVSMSEPHLSHQV